MVGVRKDISPIMPRLEDEELFANLSAGKYTRVVLCTGAGISTAAGIKDFRSEGGLFEDIYRTWGERFPKVLERPEWLLSRDFIGCHPSAWKKDVEPWLRDSKQWADKCPTIAHRFCGWLHRRGWLRRVYTQNIDGLHSHPDSGVPADRVVECHGNMREGTMVMYGDSLPQRFQRCLAEDFPAQDGVDLLMVLGTSLQVAPFCAVPNMAPKGCVRVLVNRDLGACLRNEFSAARCGLYCQGVANQTTHLGSRKSVPLRPLWRDRTVARRWQQVLIASECDEFVQRFFASPTARIRRMELDS